MTAGVLYCVACSAENPDDSAFCAECGARLEASTQTAEPAAPSPGRALPGLPPLPPAPPVPQSATTEPVPKVNRKVVQLFPPPPEKRDLPLVARSWSGRAAALDPATSSISRNREIAYGLPEWDPLPPGEARVSRRMES